MNLNSEKTCIMDPTNSQLNPFPLQSFGVENIFFKQLCLTDADVSRSPDSGYSVQSLFSWHLGSCLIQVILLMQNPGDHHVADPKSYPKMSVGFNKVKLLTSTQNIYLILQFYNLLLFYICGAQHFSKAIPNPGKQFLTITRGLLLLLRAGESGSHVVQATCPADCLGREQNPGKRVTVLPPSSSFLVY